MAQPATQAKKLDYGSVLAIWCYESLSFQKLYEKEV
jgi:hypothetical protein